MISRLSIPQNNGNKYARGTAVYGDVADGVDDEGNEYRKYRNNDNVLYRDVLVLDYDDEDDLNMLHKSIKSELEGFAWFWHTTFRHTNESPRIRLYVPLSERISANEYRAYVRTLAQKLRAKLMRAVINHLGLWRYPSEKVMKVLLNFNLTMLQY